MKLPAVTRGNRWYALSVLVVAQTVFFLLFVPHPPRVLNDNTRYEVAGYYLSAGKGLSLPSDVSADPDVLSWACARHPEACPSEDGVYPTAIYPPGYQVYIGMVYKVFGRNLYALLYSQLALLLGMFALYEAMAAKLLDKSGYWFCVAAGATYPYIARQATIVLSDHVYAVLLLASLSTLVLMKPSKWRGVLFGLTFGLATITRPYSLLVIPALFLVPAVRKGANMGWAEWAIAGFAVTAPFVVWTARNEYVFGRFIPLSTQGLGTSLYLNKLEWTIGPAVDGENAAKTMDELKTLAGGDGDFTRWQANLTIQAMAFEWMKHHPGLMFIGILKRIPRLWISVGYASREQSGLARGWILIVSQLGTLFGLGVAGLWIKRRDARWAALALTVLIVWAFLLHTPAEARRTLPLRLPMMLYAGTAFSALDVWWARWRARRPLTR